MEKNSRKCVKCNKKKYHKYCKYEECKDCCISKKCKVHYLQPEDIDIVYLEECKEILTGLKFGEDCYFPLDIVNKIVDEYVDIRLICGVCKEKLTFEDDDILHCGMCYTNVHKEVDFPYHDYCLNKVLVSKCRRSYCQRMEGSDYCMWCDYEKLCANCKTFVAENKGYFDLD